MHLLKPRMYIHQLRSSRLETFQRPVALQVVAEASDAVVPGVGFRVQGSGFRVQGSGFRVDGLGFRVQGAGLRVEG